MPFRCRPSLLRLRTSYPEPARNSPRTFHNSAKNRPGTPPKTHSGTFTSNLPRTSPDFTRSLRLTDLIPLLLFCWEKGRIQTAWKPRMHQHMHRMSMINWLEVLKQLQVLLHNELHVQLLSVASNREFPSLSCRICLTEKLWVRRMTYFSFHTKYPKNDYPISFGSTPMNVGWIISAGLYKSIKKLCFEFLSCDPRR